MTVTEQTAWLEQSVGVRILRDQIVVRVSGADAREWLNGQVTQKISEVPAPDTSTYAMIVDLKGRVIADVWVLDRDVEFWLLLPKESADKVLEVFDRYIIMEDVELQTMPSSILTAQGPRAADLLELGWPTDRLGVGGRESIVPRGAATEHFDSLVHKAKALGGGAIEEPAWELVRLRQGRPRFGVDFGDWTYPQETGLKDLAVSFTKGCYVGQEAVIMLEHRGAPPKRLCTFKLDAKPGESIGASIMRGDEKVGAITSAVRDGATTVAIGSLLRRVLDDAGGLTVAGSSATTTHVIGD